MFLNPGAGAGRAAARLGRLLEGAAPGAPADWTVVETRGPGDVGRGLEGLGPGTVPVAAGGDGTVGMVARALDAAGLGATPLGLLPLGTANILARELGMGTIREALGALSGSAVRPLDLLRTDHPEAPVVVASLSGGFEGTFIARYAALRRRSRILGGLRGLTALAGAGASVELEVDGEEMLGGGEPVFAAGLYNTRCYAGGVVMSPGADPSDGLAEAVAYRTARAFWGTVLDGRRGGGGARPGVLRRPWRTARLHTTGPLQADGEPVEGGRVEIRLHPGALRVLVPGPRTRFAGAS